MDNMEELTDVGDISAELDIIEAEPAPPTNQDLNAELLSLLAKMDKGKVKELLGVGQGKTVHITRRKYVTVHYRCLTCETQWVHTAQLMQGEDMIVRKQQGEVTTIKFTTNSSPLTVSAVASKCSACPRKISRWPREKLEERFLDLLNRLHKQVREEFL